MDKAAMVVEELTQERIRAGKALIRELEKAHLAPDAVFWLYSSETDTWQLVIAEIKVATEGPRAVYRRIQELLTALSRYRKVLGLEDIRATTPDDNTVKRLRQAVRTDPDLEGSRFKGNVIDGTLIEDAYIYRVA
jgi:hypothetical protein